MQIEHPKRETVRNLGYLKEEEVRKLLRIGYKSDRDRMIVKLQVVLGLRQIEIERLNLENLKRHGQHWVLEIHGKGRKELVEMNVTEKIAKELQDQHEPGAKPMFTTYGPSSTGGRMTTSIIRKTTTYYLDKAGFNLKEITPHRLRATAAVMLLVDRLREGVDRRQARWECQEMLRHEDQNVTRIYIKEADKILRRGQQTGEMRNQEKYG